MIIESSFEHEELDFLTKQFRIKSSSSQNQQNKIKAIDLLDEDKCAAYLDWLTGILQSPSRMITASQFAKRYAFITIFPSLYAMTIYDKGLNLSIEHCYIESAYQNGTWLPNLHVTDLQANKLLASEKRHEWRDEIIKTIFTENLAKVWRSISKVSKVPMPILWENTAVRVYSLYEKKIGIGVSDREKSRIQEDFDYIINGAPATLFEEKKNPLKVFYNSKSPIHSSDQSIRIRTTCCFYYKVCTDGEYCTNCPKIFKHQ